MAQIRTERWRERLLSFDAEIAITGEPAARARLHHAAGRLLEERLERNREALARYRQASVEDPGYRPALRDARRLYRAGGQHLMVADVLSREAECAADGGERASLLWDRGVALEAAEGDPREIRAAYEDALRADPSNLPALHSLAEVLRRDGDWTGLSGAYREAAAAVGDETVRAGILCDLARLCELHLSDIEAACTFYGEAAEADPTHLVALVELERLARRLSRHHLLAKTLEWAAELSAVGPDAAHDWEEVARIRFHCVDDEAGAVAAMRRALDADPDHVPSFDRTEELLREHDAWEELAELYSRRARATVGAEQKAAILCQQAQVLETRLAQPEAAAAAYAAAAAVCATYLPALRALGAKLEAESDWEGLVRLYLAEAEAQTDPEMRGARLLRAAELLDRQIDDPERAVEVLRRAVRLGPGRLAATRQLVALLSRKGLWLEACGVLREEAERCTDTDQAAEHLHRLADIRENHLADPEAAVEALQSLLEVRPGDPDARWHLVRLCRQQGRWDEVIAIRLKEAESLSDPRAVAAALFDAAEVQEVRLADLQAAEDSYRSALNTHPGYVPALRALGRILQAAGRWEELVQMYQCDLDVEEVEGQRAENLLRMGDVLWRRLGQEKEAEEAYLEAIRLRPGDQAALSSLETIYRSWGDAESLTDVLEQRVTSADDPADRARILCALAEVLEDEGAPEDQVVDAWTRAVAQDSGCIPALRALSRLHEESGRWEEMARVLEQEADAGGDAVRRLLRSLRLASVRRDRIGDEAGALEAYRRAIAADPGHVPALQALDSALRELHAADKKGRAEVLASLALVLDDPKTAAASRIELARLLSDEGDAVGALERYAEALRLDPGNVVAMEALEHAHRAEGDWGALARLYQQVRNEAADPEMQVDFALRAARALDRSGDPAGAREVLEEAATRRRGDTVLLSELVEARENAGDRISALDAAEALARLRRSKERAVSELIACGDAWRDQENSPQRALQLYQDAFLLAPSHEAAVERVEAMLLADGDTGRLIAALHSGLEVAEQPAVRAAILRRLARVHRDCGDLDQAKETLAQALIEASDDVEALQAQAQVLQEMGESVEAAESWERLTRHARSDEDLRHAWLSVARLTADRPDQAERADVALRFILDRWPEDEEGLTLQQLFAETNGDAARAIDAAERRADLQTERRARVERLLDLARLHRQEDDWEGEAAALRRAREADQSAAEPVARMGDLLRLVSDLDGIEKLYREYAAGLSASEEARAVPFLMELADLGRERGLADAAIADYSEVLRLDADSDDARHALADLYAALPLADGADKAVVQHMDLLVRDPFRLMSYQALARLYERTRNYDAAFLAAGILEYLGALEDQDRPLLDDLRSRSASAPRGRLDHDDRMRFLRHGDEGDGVRIWLKAMAPVAEKLCTTDAKALGAKRSLRIVERAGEQDPLRSLLDRLSGITGTPAAEIEAYRVPEGEVVAFPLPGQAPIIVLAESQLQGVDLATRRFHLAQALALAADASALVANRSAQWTAVALATMSDEAGVRGDLKPIPADVRKSAEGAVHELGVKRLRKYAGEQSDRVRKAVPFDRLVCQLEATQRTANRVAALASADSLTALTQIGGAFPSAYPTQERIVALSERPAVRDLLAFLVSEEHTTLRTRLGLTLR